VRCGKIPPQSLKVNSRLDPLNKQLKKSKRPLILTVNGKAAAVVQEAEAYQHYNSGG
jgi:PHD/YefM family antitoxin component YafN of YafNO toxin-antitoxin module